MRKRSIIGVLRRGAGLVVGLSVVALLAALPADGQRRLAPEEPVAEKGGAEAATRVIERPDRPSTTTTSLPPSEVAIVPAAVTDTNGSTSTAPIVDALAASGIPEIAMRAYLAAQNTMATKDPTCNLRWSLVAALGRVESNHGRFQGAQLREDGTGTKPIRGIPLDGRPGVMTIRDTDGGQLDGDPIYDRAVGPMQFIPSSWRFAAADGNGDGKSDPDNIYDAALAAGGYLCAGDTNLADPHQRSRAVYRYNHSEEYVQTVLSLADRYEQGQVEIPHSEPAPAPGTPPELPSPELPPASPPDPPVDLPPLTDPPTTTTTSPSTTSPPSSSSTTTTTTAPCPTTTTTSTSSTTTTETTTTTTAPGSPCPTDVTTTTTTTATTTTSTTSTTSAPGSTEAPSSTTTTGGG